LFFFVLLCSSNTLPAQDCITAMAEELCEPGTSIFVVHPGDTNNPLNDGDACTDVVVQLNSLPVTCPCEYQDIAITFDFDSDGDGVYDTNQLIGTYQVAQNLFVDDPLPIQLGGSLQDMGGISFRNPPIGIGSVLVFDINAEFDEIQVNLCVNVDCNGNGGADCVICSSQEVSAICH